MVLRGRSGWEMRRAAITCCMRISRTSPGRSPCRERIRGFLRHYQEKPKVYPLQLILEFDPKRDAGRYFPLTMAVGTTPETATKAALEKKLAAMTTGAQQLYEKTADYYAHFFDDKLTSRLPTSSSMRR